MISHPYGATIKSPQHATSTHCVMIENPVVWKMSAIC